MKRLKDTEHPTCFVFGAGIPPAFPPKISERDMVIAADGGYLYTQSAKIRADVIIGDFDSLDGALNQEGNSPLVIRLPKEKNETDALAALNYGLQQGFRRFYIYGGTGGRLDHTLANIQCLSFLLNRGAKGYLSDGDTVITAVRGCVRLKGIAGGVISVFALGGAAGGVCLRGLKYELNDVTLTADYPLGVSNEFTNRPAYVGTGSGDLLLIYPAGTHEHDSEIEYRLG